MQTGNPQAGHGRVLAAVLAGALALLLAACHPTPPPSNATPDKAVATSLRLIATGDFDGLMRNRLPAPAYAEWRKAWHAQHAQPIPASVAQEKQFARIMQMLTEPDAETKLLQRLQPTLANMHSGTDETLPILGGIVKASLQQAIEATPQLGPTQRSLASEVLAAAVAQVESVDFSDPAKAKKAIALVCATARQLHVQTLGQWRALDYAATMHAYGVLWNGMESLLNMYGIDIGRGLTRAKITALPGDAGKTGVQVALTIAGKQLTAQWAMRKLDGHWYSAALLDAWREAHPLSAASNASTGTPAGGATAAPAAVPSTAAPPPAASVTGLPT